MRRWPLLMQAWASIEGTAMLGWAAIRAAPSIGGGLRCHYAGARNESGGLASAGRSGASGETMQGWVSIPGTCIAGVGVNSAGPDFSVQPRARCRSLRAARNWTSHQARVGAM